MTPPRDNEMKRNKLIRYIALFAALICTVSLLGACSKDSGSAENCTAVITIRDYGKITVALDADAAPITVANFVKLAESGFYDGLIFHRLIVGLMMQGGES